MTLRQHYVTFHSPGTFVDEETRREIDEWDTALAIEMAAGILERYDAKPYGFRFSTRERGPDDLDASTVDVSPMHYLGGTVWTLDDLRSRNDPDDRILIANMEANDWERAIRVDNSYPVWEPLNGDDIVHQPNAV